MAEGCDLKNLVQDAAKLDATLLRWTPEELEAVVDALEENHLASAKAISLRLMRQIHRCDKKTRDVEILLERIARSCPLAVSADGPEAAAKKSPTNSYDAFLCILDDLVPGGLDYSTQLPEVLIEAAGSATGQLGEAHLFLVSLLDGRPFNPNRLSARTSRRLLSMLSDLLAEAKAATGQVDCLRDLMGLAHLAASLPGVTVLRDKVQAQLRMPLSAAAIVDSSAAEQTAAAHSKSAKTATSLAVDFWERNQIGILSNYSTYSMNPLNLPDQLLRFPGDQADGQHQFSLEDGDPSVSFVERYMNSKADLIKQIRIADLYEPDEDFLMGVSAKLAPVDAAAVVTAAPARPIASWVRLDDPIDGQQPGKSKKHASHAGEIAARKLTPAQKLLQARAKAAASQQVKPVKQNCLDGKPNSGQGAPYNLKTPASKTAQPPRRSPKDTAESSSPPIEGQATSAQTSGSFELKTVIVSIVAEQDGLSLVDIDASPEQPHPPLRQVVAAVSSSSAAAANAAAVASPCKRARLSEPAVRQPAAKQEPKENNAAMPGNIVKVNPYKVDPNFIHGKFRRPSEGMFKIYDPSKPIVLPEGCSALHQTRKLLKQPPELLQLQQQAALVSQQSNSSRRGRRGPHSSAAL